MNAAHLHLILTHVPVLGVGFGALLLGFGMWRNHRAVQQAALVVLVLSGLAALGAYLTGEGAEEVMEDRAGFAKSYLERHEDAGLIALILAGIGGVMALMGLGTGWKGRPFSRLVLGVTLLLSLATGGTLAWVANLGGQIGHPEIRADQTLPSGEGHEEGEH